MSTHWGMSPELNALISVIAQIKLPLLISFAVGVFIAVLAFFVLRPLIISMTRNEANRVILSETQSLSTYAWGSLGCAAFVGSYFLLHVRLPGQQGCELVRAIGVLSTLLMIVCLFSILFMTRLQMKTTGQPTNRAAANTFQSVGELG